MRLQLNVGGPKVVATSESFSEFEFFVDPNDGSDLLVVMGRVNEETWTEVLRLTAQRVGTLWHPRGVKYHPTGENVDGVSPHGIESVFVVPD